MGAGTWGGVDARFSTEKQGSLADAHQAPAGLAVGLKLRHKLWIEAAAIVSDIKPYPVRFEKQRNLGTGGLRVLGEVG